MPIIKADEEEIAKWLHKRRRKSLRRFLEVGIYLPPGGIGFYSNYVNRWKRLAKNKWEKIAKHEKDKLLEEARELIELLTPKYHEIDEFYDEEIELDLSTPDKINKEDIITLTNFHEIKDLSHEIIIKDGLDE